MRRLRNQQRYVNLGKMNHEGGHATRRNIVPWIWAVWMDRWFVTLRTPEMACSEANESRCYLCWDKKKRKVLTLQMWTKWVDKQFNAYELEAMDGDVNPVNNLVDVLRTRKDGEGMWFLVNPSFLVARKRVDMCRMREKKQFSICLSVLPPITLRFWATKRGLKSF